MSKGLWCEGTTNSITEAGNKPEKEHHCNRGGVGKRPAARIYAWLTDACGVGKEDSVGGCNVLSVGFSQQ